VAAKGANQPLVLVADDEEGVRTMVALALKAQGFDSVLCADGDAALAAIEDASSRGGSFDAALFDIRMPNLDGLTLVRQLRRRPDAQALPVVVMSAYNDSLQERQVIEAGADGFLPKPFTIAELRSTLDAAIGARRP
jgi:CheY-like chemotaxis protein